MPRGKGRLVLDNFLGGLNVRDDPVNLALDESPSLTDFVPYGEGGAIVQRAGDDAYHNFSGITISRFWASAMVSGALLAYATSNGNVYGYNPATQTTLYTPGAGSYVSEGFVAFEAPTTGGQGPIFFRARDAASANVFRYWTGSGAAGTWTASAGTLPGTYWYIYASNRVWAVRDFPSAENVPGASMLYWSALGDARNWPSANTLQLDPGDGQGFSGVGRVGDVLVVFKPNKAWVIYDLDTGANRALGEDVGTNNGDLICTTPVGLFFVDSSRGPMLTDGSNTRPLENGTKLPANLISAAPGSAKATYANDHIYVGSSFDNYLYDYDLKTRSWWRHDGRGSLSYPVASATGLVYVNSTGGQIDRLFTGVTGEWADGTTAILPAWDSPHLALGAPAENKRLRSLEVVGDGNASVKRMLEVNGAFTTLKTGSLDPPGLVVPTPGVGRAPRLQIVKSSGDDLLRLDQVVLDFSVRHK